MFFCLALQGDGEGPDVPAGQPICFGGVACCSFFSLGLEKENGILEMGY